MKDIKYVRAFVPYGYTKNEKNCLIPDSPAAKIVKNIFKWKIEGMNATSIADRLNDMGILSPAAHKAKHGIACARKDTDNNSWSFGIVLRILRNEVYTGTLVQGKSKRCHTDTHDKIIQVSQPSEKWIRIENAHEALISKSDYDLVQTLLKSDGNVYLFSGLLICGCCGSHMVRKTVPYKDKKYYYYYCPTGKKNGCTDAVMVNEKKLIRCVTESLKVHIKNAISTGKESVGKSVDLDWAKHYEPFANIQQLDRHSVVTMIDSITVLGKKELCIKYRFASKPFLIQL